MVREKECSSLQEKNGAAGLRGKCRMGAFVTTLGLVLSGAALGALIGNGIGYIMYSGGENEPHHSRAILEPSNETEITLLAWGALVRDVSGTASSLDKATGLMSNRNIEDTLKLITKLPRVAGLDQNNRLANDIYKEWVSMDFDDVSLVKYQVLLQYPNESNPNRFQILNETGYVVFNAHSAQSELPLTDDERVPGVVRPFNSYSAIGSAKGPLVYLNYGTRSDYAVLSGLGINVTGCVCLARYGATFRGSQVKLAQENGCVGLVLYTDPEQFGPKEGHPAYPKGGSLPLSGVQRGSVQSANGDPLTPLLPSIPGVYRRPYEEAVQDRTVPSIPVTPISSGDALHFLRSVL